MSPATWSSTASAWFARRAHSLTLVNYPFSYGLAGTSRRSKYALLATPARFFDQLVEGGNYTSLDNGAIVHATKVKNVWTFAGNTSAKLVGGKAVETAGNGVAYMVDAVMKPSPHENGLKGLSTGAIVAIVIGGVAALICVASLVYNMSKQHPGAHGEGHGYTDMA